MSSGVDIVILAEEVRHCKLLHKHLIKRGYSHHKIRVTFPKKTGIQGVKEQYPNEVEALRA